MSNVRESEHFPIHMRFRLDCFISGLDIHCKSLGLLWHDFSFPTVSKSSFKIVLFFSSTNYIAVPERKVLKLSSSVVWAEVLPQTDESEMPVALYT